MAELGEFWRGEKKIILLDPNITASKECEQLFDSLITSGAWVEFNQGIDARLLTDKGVDQLNRMRIKMVHFAWDNYEMQTYEKLKKIRQRLEIQQRNARVYVLTNYNTTHSQDMERIRKLKELGFDPFVMIYDKPSAPKVTRQLQRWCNNKYVFYACTWEEYGRDT